MPKIFIFFIIIISLFYNRISAQPQISFNIDSLYFGEFYPQTPIQTQDTLYILNNSGTDTLKIFSINKALAYSAFFVYPLIDTIDIPPNDSSELVVYFAISKYYGTYIDTILIQSNDPINPDTSLLIMGKVIDTDIQLSATYFDFGNIQIGNSISDMLIITNAGNMALEIDSISNVNSVFSLSDTSLTVGADSADTVIVEFKPTEATDYVDTLRIYSNDRNSGILEFEVSGRGFINHAPVVTQIPDTTIYVDSLFSLQVEATDQENDSISYLLLATPGSSYGKMTISDTGLIQWKPDMNFKDSYVEVVFRVSDVYGKSTYVSFKINVLTFNHPPEIINKISEILITEDFDSLIVADLDTIFSDRDPGTVLEYSAVSDTSEVVIYLTSENNVFIITQENYFGSSALILSASDGENTIYDTVNVSVLPINDPPVIVFIPDTVINEESLFIYQVQVEDVDSENFNYELLFYPYGMTVDSLGLIEWLSDDNDVGDTVATVVVYDDSLASDSLTFNITVVNIINNPPVISGIPDIITVEDFSDSSINLYDYVSDSDNDTIDLRFEASGYSNIEVSINKNLVKITPHNNWSGEDSVIFTAFDPSDAYSTDAISIQVTAVNDPPVISNIPDTTIYDNRLFKYQVQVEDIDSDDIDYELGVYPDGMEIDSLGMIQWLTNDDDVGDTIVTVVVYDDSLASDSFSFNINIANINNPPVLSGIPDITIVEDFSDSSINLYDYVSDSDNDKNEINFYVLGITNVAAVIDIDNVKITPNVDWNGIDTLIFKASDPSDAFSMDTVLITIIPVNDPPVIKNLENLSFNEEDTLMLSLNRFAYDIDDSFETLKWEIYGGENISFSIQDTSAIFWAISDWNGSEDLKFILTDSSGFKDSTVAEISVLNINNPPVILSVNPDEDSVFIEKGGYVDFTFSGDDVDGDILNVVWNLNGSIVSSEKIYRYTAGDIMEVKSLKLIISDGEKSVFRDWVIMSGWEVSIVLESFYALDLKEGGVEIRWNILNSEGNLGFNILRSKNESGNYEKINDELIYDNGENGFAFFDNNIKSGERYYYKLEYIDILGNKLQHGPISILTSIPEEWNLFQNYPNPFNSETTINFSIPEHSSIKISIYSVNGKLICALIDKEFEPGFYTVKWDGKNSSGYFVSSGIYFCILKNEKNIFVKKIIFFK